MRLATGESRTICQKALETHESNHTESIVARAAHAAIYHTTSKILGKVVRQAGATIVLSSTWRTKDEQAPESSRVSFRTVVFYSFGALQTVLTRIFPSF